MNISPRVNLSEFELKCVRTISTARTREKAVREAAEHVVRRQIELASDHIDTGRYARATAEAGNAAGIGKFLLAPITPSKMAVRMHRILINQVGRWQRRKVAYERAGRQKEREYKRILKMLRRAREELQKWKDNQGRGVIMIGAFNNSEKLATVRVNFAAYGGSGAVRNFGSKTVVMLHNKEPHASIVEYRFGITRTALRESTILKRIAKKVYQQHLRQSGFKVG